MDQDSTKYKSFKNAWMASVSEYNSYGLAQFASRFRIDNETALSLFGFKAAWQLLVKKSDNFQTLMNTTK